GRRSPRSGGPPRSPLDGAECARAAPVNRVIDSESEPLPVNGGARGVDAPASADLLSQAWMLYLSSGFRYWSAVADAWADVLPLLSRAAADLNGVAASDAPSRAVRLGG